MNELETFKFAVTTLGSGGDGHKKSEELLLGLRSSKTAIVTSLQVLKMHPPLPLHFRLHAVLLLRDASLKQYSTLPKSEIQELLNEVLALSRKETDSRAQLSLFQSLAILWKRIWLELTLPSDYVIPLQIIDDLFNKGHGGEESNPILGAIFMRALIFEFSSAKSSNIGQSLEFHARCAHKFQNLALKECFNFTLIHLARLHWSDDAVIVLLQCLDAILNWPFQLFHNEASLLKAFTSYNSTYASSANSGMSYFTKIFPPKNWHDAMFGGGGGVNAVELLHMIYVNHHGNVTRKVMCRQCLILLAGVHGAVFENELEEKKHCEKLLETCLFFITNPTESLLGNKQDYKLELSDFCLIASKCFFLFHGGGDPINVAALGRVCTIMQQLLSSNYVWMNDVVAPLIDAWTSIGGNSLVKQCNSVLFAMYVKSKCNQARDRTSLLTEEDEEEEEEEDEEESDFVRIALLGRISPIDSCKLLVGLLNRAIQDASNVNGNQKQEEETMEELCFLGKVASYLIADTYEGETPLVPKDLLQYPYPNEMFSVIMEISACLLKLFEVKFSSPFVNVQVLRALKRWTCTYFLLDVTQYDESVTFPVDFLTLLKKREIMEFLFNRCNFLLLKFCAKNTEVAIHVLQLIKILVVKLNHKSNLHLSKVENYEKLIQAHIESVSTNRLGNWDPLGKLPPQIHGELVSILCISCKTKQDFLFLNASLQDVWKRIMFEQDRNHPAWYMDVNRLIEMYRGVARAHTYGSEASSLSREMIVASLEGFYETATLVLSKGNEEVIVSAVLSLFIEFSENHLIYMEGQNLNILYKVYNSFVTQVFVGFYARNRTKNEALNDSLTEEFEKVLRLLITLLDRQVLNFDEYSDLVSNGEDSAPIVLNCLDFLLPFVDQSMMAFPNVLKLFFDLVSSLCKTNPSHFGSLPQKLFASLCINCFQFGLTHFDLNGIVKKTFEALAGLFEHHIKSNFSLLGNQLVFFPTFFFDWLKIILSLVVYQVESLLDFASDCLYYLLGCCQEKTGAYLSLVAGEICNELLVIGELELQHVRSVLLTDIPMLHLNFTFSVKEFKKELFAFKKRVEQLVERSRGYVRIR